MLGFYFFHSVWNQLRRFIRTWAFLLFCGLVLVGSFLWYAARWYYHRLVAADPALPEDISELFTVSGMTVLNVTELVSGILILGILIIQILSAEKSVSRLFLQADVNLLFSSDRSPQEVLVFRVSNTVGLGVAAAVLILIRIPFLIRDYSLYGAISVLVSWCFLLVFSVLFKILIYETANRHPLFGLSLRWFIFAGIGVGGVLLYHAYKISDDLPGTLHQYLNEQSDTVRSREAAGLRYLYEKEQYGTDFRDKGMWRRAGSEEALLRYGSDRSSASCFVADCCSIGVLAFMAINICRKSGCREEEQTCRTGTNAISKTR